MDNKDLEFDVINTNWNDKIMPKDIFTHTYDIAHFLLNHNHPIIESLKPIVLGKYRVQMKFTNSHASGSIWVNNRWLVARKQKHSKVMLGKNVKLIEGTPTAVGGSNSYPVPGFKEGYCIVEFISNGLPMTKWSSGWKSEIVLLEPIEDTQKVFMKSGPLPPIPDPPNSIFIPTNFNF